MQLPKTGDALSDLRANAMHGYGVHASSQFRAGGGGQYLGDMPFDPAVHEASDINPLSSMGLAFDQPHVSVYRPERPLRVNLVADYRNLGGNTGIQKAKHAVADHLNEEVYEALSGVTDRLDTFVLGSDQHEFFDRRTQELVTAEDVAELCLNGLTVVVSDFSHLKIAAPEKRFDSAIAVKVNHLLERQVPSNVGVIALSGKGEVNTNKARKLNVVNQELAREHDATVSGLQQQGFEVVPVVVRADQGPHGYDVSSVDHLLAEAVGNINRRQQ